MLRILCSCLALMSIVGPNCFGQEKSAKKKSASANEYVTFDGVKLLLEFDTKDDNQALKEYIPEGETLEKWERLASVRVFKKFDDPKNATEALALGVKTHNPLAQLAIKHLADKGESVIDFVTWPPDGSFVEFNVFKYVKHKQGGLVAYQYALRKYGDEESKQFLRDLRPLRLRLVKLMTEKGLDTNKTTLPKIP